MSSVTGSPTGSGSIILIDGPYYQDAYLTCTATLDDDCDEGGLVFGYIDHENYWVRIYSNTGNWVRYYQVSGGSWTQRNTSYLSITSGTPFTMETNTYGSPKLRRHRVRHRSAPARLCEPANTIRADHLPGRLEAVAAAVPQSAGEPGKRADAGV